MLDRSSDAPPLYTQVARVLAAQIGSGIYAPGDQLPSEPVLSHDLEVSRATVSKAFDDLERGGLIQRRQGRGTFVAPRPRSHSLTEVSSFSKVTEATGAVPTHRLVSYRPVAVGGRRDDLLATFADAIDLVVLERVRLSDDIPVGFHRVALPAHVLSRAGIAEADLARADFSLYRALSGIGQQPFTAEEWLRAKGCPADVATHLDTETGSPMMRVRRISRNRDGEVIEAVDAYYIGSLYEYHTILSSPLRSNDERDHHAVKGGRRSGGGIRVAVTERLRRDSTWR